MAHLLPHGVFLTADLAVLAMEKTHSHPAGPPTTGLDLKAGVEESIVRDGDVGEMLAVDYTPAQERKLIRKLDFACAHHSIP